MEGSGGDGGFGPEDGGAFPPPGEGDGDFEGDDMYGEGDDLYDDGQGGIEEEEEVVLEPDNPLYARIKAVLEKQLTDQNQRLVEDLREKEEELKRIRKKKEDVGVELYGVQQQLARMQLTLEKTHDNFNIVRKLREEAESDAKAVTKDMEKKKSEVVEQQKRMTKFQSELDKLNTTLQQVEAYNNQMTDEIAVTRRATYKAEEQVQVLEKEKKMQDLLIDDLMRGTKQLEDQIDLRTEQLLAQQNETKGAMDVLQEAGREMERIRFEKKQLIAQWKSSLLAVERRDEHLQSLQKALRDLQQDEQTMTGEISSFKQSIRKEQDRNEAVLSILTKVKNSVAYLEKQIEGLRGERVRLNEQYQILKSSLEQSDAELLKVQQEKKQVDDETSKVEKELASTMNETQRQEQQILTSLAEQTTLQKAAQSTDRQTQSMQEGMHVKENEMAQVRNELARIKVDSLNTIAHNDQLKSTVQDIDAELKRKEQLIAKYEVEIRRRNDEIEKKMRDLDTLNRRFEGLRAKFEQAAGADAAVVGPLEATIKSLRNEVDQKRKICNDLQRMWMSTQTELVKLSNEASVQSERVGEMKSQAAVLTQKRVRVEGQVRVQQAEVTELQASIALMHTDMSKLNELIGKNQNMYDKLEGNTFTLEADFANSLKDLEEDAIRVESQIRTTLEHKERIKEELVEMERQIMETERKVELEKEMQAAYLQKDEGSEVMIGMKREIHRMQLRYSQLMRRQEELMVEMERSIFKRDSINVRGKIMQQSKAKGGGSQMDVKKVIADLSKRVAENEKDISRYDRQIKQLDAEGKDLGRRMEEAGASVKEVQREEDGLHKQMHAIDKRKAALKEEILTLHKMIKRYAALEQGRYEGKDPEEVTSELQRAQERREALVGIMRDLARDHPDVESDLAPILERHAGVAGGEGGGGQ